MVEVMVLVFIWGLFNAHGVSHDAGHRVSLEAGHGLGQLQSSLSKLTFWCENKLASYEVMSVRNVG